MSDVVTQWLPAIIIIITIIIVTMIVHLAAFALHVDDVVKEHITGSR